MDTPQRFIARLTHMAAALKDESERTKVIILSGHMDILLEEILKAFLVPSPQSSDQLFEGPNAVFSSFSNKIDMAYRLGIVSPSMTKALHLTRKIRNVFAHSIDACSLETHEISSRIKELLKLVHYPPEANDLTKDLGNDQKSRFFFAMAMMVFSLEHCASSTEHREQAKDDFPFLRASG